MNYFLRAIFFILISTSGFSATKNTSLPAYLVKVTSDINPKCVVFVSYQGEMYCSLIPIENNPVAPNVLTYEKQAIHFDNRPWKAAWAKHTDYITSIEYLPLGDNINDWHELITSQFISGLDDVTVKQFQTRFFKEFDKAGITYKITSLITQPQMLVFEFQVEKPENLQQDEIQKIVKEKNGIYVLHYAIKKEDMGKVNRHKWIKNIKSSTIKN